MWLCFYVVQLVSLSGEFAGFLIQARAQSNQDSRDSIVGVWTPSNGEAKTTQCNGVNGVSSKYNEEHVT